MKTGTVTNSKNMVTIDEQIKTDNEGWPMQNVRLIDLLKALNIVTDQIPEEELKKKIYVMNTIPVVDLQVWDDSIHFWLEDNQELHT